MLLVLPLVSRTGFGASPLPFLEPQPQPPELREALGSKEAVEPKDREGSSGDEETFGSPGKRPNVGIIAECHNSFLGPVIQKHIAWAGYGNW